MDVLLLPFERIRIWNWQANIFAIKTNIKSMSITSTSRYRVDFRITNLIDEASLKWPPILLSCNHKFHAFFANIFLESKDDTFLHLQNLCLASWKIPSMLVHHDINLHQDFFHENAQKDMTWRAVAGLMATKWNLVHQCSFCATDTPMSDDASILIVTP